MLKNVNANDLLNVVKNLDQTGRDIVIQGISGQLSEIKKQELLTSLRAAASSADADVRNMLVKSISESYVHGMNYTSQLASINVSPDSYTLYKWTDATPAVDTVWERARLIAGDANGTVGDGIYFSLDPNSSKEFGNVLNTFQLPKSHKLLDITKGKTTGSTGFAMHPIEREALKNNVDIIEMARRKGYDGVIFQADDGTNKWVALTNEVAKTALVGSIPKFTPISVSTVLNSAEFSPHLSAINALLSDAYLDFGGAMTSFVRSGEKVLNDALKRQIRSTLIEGRLEGKAIKDIKKTVRETFENRGFIGLTDRGGRQWSLDRYSEMLTRTHIIRANNEGAINRARDFSIDIVEISTHFTQCPICKPYEGKIFSISGKSKNYPSLDGNEPPYHPNCKHSVMFRPELE